MTEQQNPEATVEETAEEKRYTQDEVNAMMQKRVGDLKELRLEVETLQGQLEAKDAENTKQVRELQVEVELAKRGFDKPVMGTRNDMVRKLVDLDSEVDPVAQIEQLEAEHPDLFDVPKGSGSGGSKYPVLESKEKPLTEQEVAATSPEEMAKPGIRERVDRFFVGQR